MTVNLLLEVENAEELAVRDSQTRVSVQNQNGEVSTALIDQFPLGLIKAYISAPSAVEMNPLAT